MTSQKVRGEQPLEVGSHVRVVVDDENPRSLGRGLRFEGLHGRLGGDGEVRDLQPQGGPASPLPSEGAGERAPSLLPGESEAIAGHAKTAAVQAMPDGSLQVHGVRVGPLSADHARALAGLLQTVSPTELRSAKASGRRPSFGGTDFEFHAADASAMGKRKAEEAAVAVAQALDGTWSKGVHTESGRVVLPRNISPGAL